MQNVSRFMVAGLMTTFSLMTALSAQAKVSPEEAAELGGPRLNCAGGEVAGTTTGVAAYTGKFKGSWPGMKGPSGYEPGPYDDEKPLFSITAENMAKYASQLTPGQKALFAKYPKTFRMDIYPSHRDFAPADHVCENTKKNAVTSEVVNNGKGVTGIGSGFLFPIPKNGLEAIWGTANGGKVWTEQCQCDVADVYPGGKISWAKVNFALLAPISAPKDFISYQDKIAAYFRQAYLLPERQKGFAVVGYQANDFTNEGTMSWQYLPGLRRVRQAPEVGFDYPVPPAGLRTVDDDYGFNGSPERYTWKLVGKKEFFVPYNNFKINDPAIKYKDLIREGSLNPDYVRYELHRVWVIEGALKEGMRHIYKSRVVYTDEDSWLALTVDNYDSRGELWRVSAITYHYSQQIVGWHRGTSIFHDLTAGTYEAGYLMNERPADQWWRLNEPLTPAMFAATTLVQKGH